MSAPAPSSSRRATTPTIDTVDLNRTMPGTNFIVTTKSGSRYEVRRNAHPADRSPVNSAKAHVFVSKDGGNEYAQYAQAVITVGQPWEIATGHVTNPIQSIEMR